MVNEQLEATVSDGMAKSRIGAYAEVALSAMVRAHDVAKKIEHRELQEWARDIMKKIAELPI